MGATKYQERVSVLFDMLDTDKSGCLSYEEFLVISDSKTFNAWMKLMDVSSHNLEDIWAAIDDGDGFIYKEEFLNGFCRLYGPASAIDAWTIKALIRELQYGLIAEKRGSAFAQGYKT